MRLGGEPTDEQAVDAVGFEDAEDANRVEDQLTRHDAGRAPARR